MLLPTTGVPLLKKSSHADSVIEPPPLPNSQNLPAALVPALRKRQTSSLLYKLSESDCAPFAWAQVVSNTRSGEQNIPPLKADSDQNMPQHQKATFQVAKRFTEAIVLRKTPWPILSHDKYSMVEEAWKLAIAAQNRQRALAGAPVDTPSVCQLPSGPSLKIDSQTREAVNHEFCILLHYQTSGYWLPPKVYIVETGD